MSNINRRDFLKISAGLAAARAGVPLLAAGAGQGGRPS